MSKKLAVNRENPRCGLCGKTKKLTRTKCCGNWICDDEDQYVMFSYARNSCSRNHRRYTLCAAHHDERHEGDWKECPECRQSYQTEMYVWYGTNEYNFEKLPKPPSYDPARCSRCGTIVKLGTDEYSLDGDDIFLRALFMEENGEVRWFIGKKDPAQEKAAPETGSGTVTGAIARFLREGGGRFLSSAAPSRRGDP